MWISDEWKDYRLVDTGAGEKIEYWKDITLRRPDPQAIWTKRSDSKLWNSSDAFYHRSPKGGGAWEIRNRKIPERWEISYKDLVFNIKLMGFKHTGLFPEQATNWDWFRNLIKKSGRKIRVLNLFAYTGGATVAALSVGAEVVHVDASKGMVSWAKENVMSSGLSSGNVRYIVDDVKKFVSREIRRGREYDAIIMDPPSYGRGPSGELWKIEDELYPLIEETTKLLSKDPLFFLVNVYTTGLTQTIIKNSLELTVGEKFGGRIECDEIGLNIEDKPGMALPCGISLRWER